MSGMSLHGGLEWPLCEAVEVKPGLTWNLQDVGDARVVGRLLRAADTEANQFKREVLHSTKLKGIGDLKRADIRHGDAEYGVCLAGLQTCFSSVFLHYASFPSFWNGNVYSLPLYARSI